MPSHASQSKFCLVSLCGDRRVIGSNSQFWIGLLELENSWGLLRKNDQFFSRVRKDLEIDLNHGSSRSKDVVVKSRIGSTQGIKGQRSPTNGSRFNTLGSKLEQLRNEIKR